ncbi:MAG: cell division protein FtsX [Candidatus Kapaibacterium sp.]
MLVAALAVVIGFGALWYHERSWCDLREKESGIILSVVLNADAGSADAYRAASLLRSLPAVAEVRVVTPEMWREEFLHRYDVRIDDVVPENPFSYNVRVRMLQGSISAESFMVVYAKCRELPVGIEEITYPSDLLRTVLETSASIIGRTIGVGILCALCVIVLLSSALRATRPLSRDDLQLLTLLGAAPAFGLRSAMWRNVLACLAGTASGSAVILLLERQLQSLWPLVVRSPLEMLVPAAAGFVVLCTVFITRFTLTRS